MAGRYQMYNNNSFKLGLFGANCSSGRAINKLPERWLADWPSCVTMARLADQSGFDFILPIGRWKGYGGPTNFQGSTFETITWACGLLGQTERVTVFGTVHAPMFNPLVVAKQMVTADHIGSGRFALNIVVGWNEAEFEMFGEQQRDHSNRYAYAGEWISAIKEIWSQEASFNYDGSFLHMHNVTSDPKPFNATIPLIINAAASDVGRDFAMRHCHGFFTNFREFHVERASQIVQDIKGQARAVGREIDVYTQGHVVCRPTRKEAEDYFQYVLTEGADLEAVDGILGLKGLTRATAPDYDVLRAAHPGKAIGYPIIGSPDDVAEKLGRIAEAGVSGIAFSLVNYVQELPFLAQELLPRLERLGVRQPAVVPS